MILQKRYIAALEELVAQVVEEVDRLTKLPGNPFPPRSIPGRRE